MSDRVWARFGSTTSTGLRVVAEIFEAETPGVNDLSDYAELTGIDPEQMPKVGWLYDGQGSYTPEVASRTIAPGEFLGKLTTAERVAWVTKARTNALLQVHKETIMLASVVNLDAVEIQGVLAALVADQVLTEARVAEVLS